MRGTQYPTYTREDLKDILDTYEYTGRVPIGISSDMIGKKHTEYDPSSHENDVIYERFDIESINLSNLNKSVKSYFVNIAKNNLLTIAPNTDISKLSDDEIFALEKELETEYVKNSILTIQTIFNQHISKEQTDSLIENIPLSVLANAQSNLSRLINKIENDKNGPYISEECAITWKDIEASPNVFRKIINEYQKNNEQQLTIDCIIEDFDKYTKLPTPEDNPSM